MRSPRLLTSPLAANADVLRRLHSPNATCANEPASSSLSLSAAFASVASDVSPDVLFAAVGASLELSERRDAFVIQCVSSSPGPKFLRVASVAFPAYLPGVTPSSVPQKGQLSLDAVA